MYGMVFTEEYKLGGRSIYPKLWSSVDQLRTRLCSENLYPWNHIFTEFALLTVLFFLACLICIINIGFYCMSDEGLYVMHHQQFTRRSTAVVICTLSIHAK